jgi:hypothetical protein
MQTIQTQYTNDVVNISKMTQNNPSYTNDATLYFQFIILNNILNDPNTTQFVNQSVVYNINNVINQLKSCLQQADIATMQNMASQFSFQTISPILSSELSTMASNVISNLQLSTSTTSSVHPGIQSASINSGNNISQQTKIFQSQFTTDVKTIQQFSPKNKNYTENAVLFFELTILDNAINNRSTSDFVKQSIINEISNILAAVQSKLKPNDILNINTMAKQFTLANVSPGISSEISNVSNSLIKTISTNSSTNSSALASYSVSSSINTSNNLCP